MEPAGRMVERHWGPLHSWRAQVVPLAWLGGGPWTRTVGCSNNKQIRSPHREDLNVLHLLILVSWVAVYTNRLL